MTIDYTEIRLQLELGPDFDAEELNTYANLLYSTLQETDANQIEKVQEDGIPVGAKGDPITLGAILLGFGIAIAPQIIVVITNWLSRQHIDSATITLTLEDGMSMTIPAGLSDQEIRDKVGLLSNELKRIRS